MITIITVNYNSIEGLQKTMESIANQSDINDIEVIIIDGGSTDGSRQLIEKKYMHVVDILVSERDKGIYDAMNKGVKLANNPWIYFLNSGDVFNNQLVIKKIKQNIVGNNKINFIYGSHTCNDIINHDQVLSLKYLTSHMINHQSIFYNKTLFATSNYDIRYKYCADYAHVLKNYLAIKPLKVDFLIADFDGSGISSMENNKKNMWYERLLAIWDSEFSILEKLNLSRRGMIAFPYHLLKGFFYNGK